MGRARNLHRAVVAERSDRFAAVLGGGRGAVRATDDIGAHTELRERARDSTGHTITMSAMSSVRDQRIEVKPLTSTILYAGERGSKQPGRLGGISFTYEAQGEIGYAPESDEWVASIHSGTWDSKSHWVVAVSPRLQVALDALAAEMQSTIAGFEEHHEPLQPQPLARAEALVLGPEDVQARLDYLESHRLTSRR